MVIDRGNQYERPITRQIWWQEAFSWLEGVKGLAPHPSGIA